MQNALFPSLRPIATGHENPEKVVNDLVHWFLEMGVNYLMQRIRPVVVNGSVHWPVNDIVHLTVETTVNVFVHWAVNGFMHFTKPFQSAKP